ncbi:helix-turn-helix domain-containing protein [Enorma burkinafasonensis]|uniref:helix-turn-helix domain-containing protein n=1 Tax=Enorma burkinafasonensis TaxID=2590867 RepID=UPI0026F218A3|nr:helix-turn-helix transcriptional regulator [Enorma burkinafasonensis]MCI7730699.1 helix-turn-helix domain-containing protein [Enorma burkinafasonensis]
MENVHEKRSLGSNIRTIRTEHGITQQKLALMTGVSRSYLWKIEIGTADVGIDVLIRIARALDMPVRDLIQF